jgi:16S rRNA processing protein RimM
MKQYFKIGKLAATFGVQGQLVLEHSLGKKTLLSGLEAIFIEEKKDTFLPYFIVSTKIKSEREIFILLDGIRSKEEALLLVKKEVWLSENDFKKFASGASPISLLGFTIISNELELGQVTEVIEQPHQLLCVVIIDRKEVLIPVHEKSLKKLDKENKKLYVDLPDGLLEIYKDSHE